MTDTHGLLATFDKKSLEYLEQFRFDAQTFAQLRDELEKGLFTKERNFLDAKLEPNQPEDIMDWPQEGSSAHRPRSHRRRASGRCHSQRRDGHPIWRRGQRCG